ncbi:hypothetical protein skT53_19740 [Effusibacillus dendaii]|uniref:Uracil-DNA glycosylase-like domain-containing protein n=1 Tax=Effusibacillus dendaii TaxID=2743772 RepID=A0A7I8DDF7_9BACL|nr:hypothetical protein skT53_19740 [Effusibacillus dendaii]
MFVGYNPSLRSSETGHHYANPRNRFYTVLYQAGLTPRKYRAEEDACLYELGYGFTNIVARPTRAAEEITKREYEEGRQTLREKITRYKPKVVCFVGKGVYLQYTGLKKAAWGVQSPSQVEGVIDFVAPSTSGLVRMKLADVVAIFTDLKELAYSIPK